MFPTSTLTLLLLRPQTRPPWGYELLTTYLHSMPVRRTLARLLSQSRQASTSAAVTAVRNVPRRNRELYAALRGLGDAAAPELISPGRLQLALRGLEMDSPWSRVAGSYKHELKIC